MSETEVSLTRKWEGDPEDEYLIICLNNDRIVYLCSWQILSLSLVQGACAFDSVCMKGCVRLRQKSNVLIMLANISYLSFCNRETIQKAYDESVEYHTKLYNNEKLAKSKRQEEDEQREKLLKAANKQIDDANEGDSWKDS